jgi:membrane-bound lytic murein transglycosylase D
MRRLAYLFIGISSFILLGSFLEEPLQAATSVPTMSAVKDQDTETIVQKSLWIELANSFKLSYPLTPEVQAHIKWYQNHPQELQQLASQASPYLYYVLQKINSLKMPAELALLPMIESNYDPFVSSTAGAGGIWQLMPRTAAGLGIHQNWWYDGRRDIAASTHAALDYLNYLQNIFDGNWLLTLAAYNSGAGAVQQAIDRNAHDGLATNFWSLRLSQQTRNYVPRLLALVTLIKEPAKYGVHLPELKNEPYLQAVDVGSQIELAEAAKLANMDLKALSRLNPGFKHWATEPHGKHRLLLPIDAVESFKANLAQLPAEKRVNWDRYAVQPGDNLPSIAKKFHVSLALIKEINELKTDIIAADAILRLPLGTRDIHHTAGIAAATSGSMSTAAKITHIVHHGETLWAIAKQYHVKPTLIYRWNELDTSDLLYPQQKLVIYTS